ncbi:MAG: PIN domain-containing protein [Thermoguttaceae bacterium]
MQKLKIYLDNCCFNRPYDDQSQRKVSFETQVKLFVQELVLKDKVHLVWSYILKFENGNNIFPAKKKAIAQWEKFSFQFVSRSEQVEDIAQQIAATGVKALDSLHIACALVAKCDYFITVDKRILKYHDANMKLCNPIEFLNIYGEEE